MEIALTGASGFVGTALQKCFEHVVIIGRNDDEETILNKLQDVDVVINLAGAPIIQRWTDPYKKVLAESRIDTTRRLVNAINKSDVSYFVSTSAIGVYPDDVVCDESCKTLSDDFLGQLSKAWEEEALKCQKPTAILRFGVVLGEGGGALAQMLTPFKLGVGGMIGNGKMITSWIHLDDLVRIYDFVIDKKLSGLFNAVAPNPVTNYVFTKALGKVLHRPTVLPIPELALRLMYGEAASVLTGSKEVYPRRLEEEGFTFSYRTIDKALEQIIIPL